jgi:hypothetical protein
MEAFWSEIAFPRARISFHSFPLSSANSAFSMGYARSRAEENSCGAFPSQQGVIARANNAVSGRVERRSASSNESWPGIGQLRDDG